MPLLYIVRNPNIEFFKIGYWSGDEVALWYRYKTYYGDGIVITLFECSSISAETRIHEKLEQFRISGELYNLENFEECVTLCTQELGTSRTLDIERAKRNRPIKKSFLYSCEDCNFNTNLKANYTAHMKSEKHQSMQALADRLSKEYESKYESKLDQLERMLEASSEKETELEETISELKRSNEILESKLKFAEGIVEKVALKPTTVNVNKSRNTTNVLNLISSEPIDMKTIQAELPKLVTVEAVLTNDKRFNEMIQSSLLQDENGKDKIVCTDYSRKHFKYLDPDGKLVSDPSLTKLIDAMKKGVNYKKLSAELLEELNAIGGDPAENRVDAQRLMKRAKFHTFSNHMAKATYKARIVFDD